MKPPRLNGAKVGVFASRSPHRPNPIGLTLAKLDGIIGNTLLLSSIDLLDGTPVLDIKPYVPDYDEPLSLDHKEILHLESSDKTFCQNMAISKNQETVDQSLSSFVGTQLVNQGSLRTRVSETLDVKADSTHASIAEWIRRPPIKELNVKFCAEALDQINCFHGKMLLRGHSSPSECDRNFDDLSVQKCTCGQNPEELSGMLACRNTDGEKDDSRGKSCVPEEATGERFLMVCQTIETDCDDGNKGKELTSYPMPRVHVDTKPDDSRGEFIGSYSKRCSLVCENVCSGFNGKGSVPLSRNEELQSSETCIYQLELLSSPEEAKRAITDILKADPRSVYRRNRCQDQLYWFSIDTMNVTCKFDDSAVVEVLQVEPVYYRNLTKAS